MPQDLKLLTSGNAAKQKRSLAAPFSMVFTDQLAIQTSTRPDHFDTTILAADCIGACSPPNKNQIECRLGGIKRYFVQNPALAKPRFAQND